MLVLLVFADGSPQKPNSRQLIRQDEQLSSLENSIPGVPGQDYPIFAEIPDSKFSCEEKVNGGKLPMNLKLKLNNFKQFMKFYWQSFYLPKLN